MRPRDSFVLLPRSLRIMFFVFFLVPMLACQLGESPWTVALRQGWLMAAVVALTYWVVPLLLSAAILIKHFWFLPVYFIQCLSLALHCYLIRSQMSETSVAVRALLILAMVALSLLFADRDFVYPFLSRRMRFWRRAHRIRIRHPLFLLWGAERVRIPAQLQDCSLTGMGITVDTSEFAGFAARMQDGESLEVEIHLTSGRYIIPTSLIWFDHKVPTGRLGLKFVDAKTMAPFVAVVTGESAAPWQPMRERFAYYWLKGGVQHFALVVWVLSITGAFFLPTSGF